jgi:NAD-dependent SIR2 family protein deacetylase
MICDNCGDENYLREVKLKAKDLWIDVCPDCYESLKFDGSIE